MYGRPVTDPLQEAATDAAENAAPLLLGRNTPRRSQEERDAANVRARAEQRAWWDAELEKARKETHGGPKPVITQCSPFASHMLCKMPSRHPGLRSGCCLCRLRVCSMSREHAGISLIQMDLQAFETGRRSQLSHPASCTACYGSATT